MSGAAHPAPTAPETSAAPAPPAPPAPSRPAFAWPGTYDVVARGFPDGDREAVLRVGRRDTAYATVGLAGPPGRLTSARFDADSAHVLWDLGAAQGTMHVWVRGAGDSLTGAWAAGDQQGLLRGRRRP